MSDEQPLMPVVDALQTIINHLSDDWIVVTNQGSARTWPKLVQRPLDLHYNPSTMGGAVPLALGLALAQPKREVLCITGDGALLMNLGSLVTVGAANPPNLTVVVLENGIYEVTGGQQTPGPAALVQFGKIAESTGFETIAEYHELRDWQREARGFLLGTTGPRFACLAVDVTPPEYLKHPTPPVGQQLARFRAAIRGD
ncbi:thiamine pyrophosphate-dependent enzyme [Anatilimnocola floriformis]|uniref:thiamine pyrophosphate-dependent enzyme n=1 Tax=Anatilimnocola floriformis TaxID=2948575 RepID=UPI0020C28DC2|nr:thiamine pyrophosphate-dependent enzyme [Anatilimnocola floriformis]